MMKLRFNEFKTTDLALFFLKKNGGKMPYLKLMKLLYIADRHAFDQYGSPITGDYYISMDYGPVLSATLDAIKNPPVAGVSQSGQIWNSYIMRENYDVRIINDKELDLSEADQDIANNVYDEYKDFDQWKTADLTHEFPEWRNPEGSAIPIDYEDILLALGKSREEAEEVVSRLSMKAFLQDFARNC